MCYCCGSGTHTLNHFYINYTIASNKWSDRTGNVKSSHQQAKEKGGDQPVDSEAYMSVFSTKTSGRSGLQIIFHERKQMTKDGSYLR